MPAEGFKIAFLAGLVRDGLVTAELNTARGRLGADHELGARKFSPADASVVRDRGSHAG